MTESTAWSHARTQSAEVVSSLTTSCSPAHLTYLDGFDCLKLKENGGPSTWQVDEEHGSLTSTMLRQYFMSIKILGRWKHWSYPLHEHWSDVHGHLHKKHPVHQPPGSNVVSPISPPAKRQKTNGNADPNPSAPVTLSTTPAPGIDGAPDYFHGANGDNDEDSESDDADIPAPPEDPEKRQRQLRLARAAVRKWRRKCGMDKTPELCDSLDSGGIYWTMGIAPRVEGRIRIVGVNA